MSRMTELYKLWIHHKASNIIRKNPYVLWSIICTINIFLCRQLTLQPQFCFRQLLLIKFAAFMFAGVLLVYLNRHRQRTIHSTGSGDEELRHLFKKIGTSENHAAICLVITKRWGFYCRPYATEVLLAVQFERNSIKTVIHDVISWLFSSFVHLLGMRWDRDRG